MAKLLTLKTFADNRGNLSVLEDKEIPFKIKRIFYIYNVDDSVRAGHRHKITEQALICITGSCRVEVNNGRQKSAFLLNHPSQCLFLPPEDWHTVSEFSPGSVLLVCASEYFDEQDYIFEDYPETSITEKK